MNIKNITTINRKNIIKAIIGGCILIIGIDAIGIVKKINDDKINLSAIPASIAGDPSLGSKTAKHTVIVYESLSCEHCRDAYTHDITGSWSKKINDGDMRVILRGISRNYADVVMETIEKDLTPAQKIMYTNYIYSHQNQIMLEWENVLNKFVKDTNNDPEKEKAGLPEETIKSIMEPILDQIGVTIKKWPTPEDIQKTIKENEETVTKINIKGTPTFIYDGKNYEEGTDKNIPF